MTGTTYEDVEYVLAEIITEATGEPRVGRFERTLAEAALTRLREMGLTLSTPPADDVRKALIKVLGDDRNWVYDVEIYFSENLAAETILAAFEVHPRGTIKDDERLEYTVAAISDNGAITSLSGESTVVRDHLRGDLELYRQEQVEAGCDPERIIIAQRPIPKWARS